MERNKLIARFFALIKALGITEGEKWQLIDAYSASVRNNNSIKDVTDLQLQNLIRSLKKRQEEQMKPMRGRIIHQLCTLGMTNTEGKADFEKINEYIKNIGKNNPRQVSLNYLYYNELKKVAKQIEAWAKSVSK